MWNDKRNDSGTIRNDLRNNMDMTRIPHPTEKDRTRLARYKKEYQTLIEALGKLAGNRR